MNNDNIQNTCQLARCYVKFQVLNQVYDQREALERGTLFPELYMPYVINEEKEKIGGLYDGYYR